MYKNFLSIFVIIIIMINSTIIISAASDVKITKPGYIASVSFDALQKTMQYIYAHDDIAFQRMLDSGLVFFLKEDLQVYIMDVKLFSGMMKIRPSGEIFEVWTLIEAVNDKQ